MFVPHDMLLIASVPHAELDEMLPAADVVIILLPLTPETRHIVDAGFLARMKKGALLVNAGRRVC